MIVGFWLIRLDILVNNAGMSPAEKFSPTPSALCKP
jgi:hypothetical protein